jgi:hypothetical protein
MAQTQIPISRNNIDIERLKRQFDVTQGLSQYRVLEILPGSDGQEIDGHIIMEGTLNANEIALVQSTVAACPNAKDPTTQKITADLQVDKDLEVDGSNTVFNTNTVTVEDNIVTLSKNNTNPPAEISSGIEVFRGGVAGNAKLIFNETDDEWQYCTGDDVHYYPIRSISNLSDGSIPRTKLAGGLVNAIVFNDADSPGYLSNSNNFKWFETTQGTGDNVWKGLNLATGFDVHLDVNCRICRGDVVNHFIQWNSSAQLEICNADGIYLWTGRTDISTNLKLTISSTNTKSSNDIIIEKVSPIFQFQPTSGNAVIRSYFGTDTPHPLHDRHAINFNSDDSLSIVSRYGETSIHSKTLTEIYNNGAVRLTVTDANTTLSNDLIINTATPVVQLTSTSGSSEVKATTGSLTVKSMSGGDLVLSCASTYLTKLQYSGVDKLTVGADTRIYTDLIIHTTSPVIQLESTSGVSEIRTAGSHTPTGGTTGDLFITSNRNLLLSTDADTLGDITLNSSGDIVTASAQLTTIKGCGQAGPPVWFASSLQLTNADTHTPGIGSFIARAASGFSFRRHTTSTDETELFSISDASIEMNRAVNVNTTLGVDSTATFGGIVNLNNNVNFIAGKTATFNGVVYVNTLYGNSGANNDLWIYSGAANSQNWVFADDASGDGNYFRPQNSRGSIGSSTYPLYALYTNRIKADIDGAHQLQFFIDNESSYRWLMNVESGYYYFRPTGGYTTPVARIGSTANPLFDISIKAHGGSGGRGGINLQDADGVWWRVYVKVDGTLDVAAANTIP